jgi:iron complex outermembrane receptor protein
MRTLAALTVLSLAVPAVAADETIVVTAPLDRYSPTADAGTRTGTPPLVVPFTVDSVGEALLTDQGLTSLQDALRTVSGTAPVTGIGGFNTRFRLRGFVSANLLRNGFRQALSVPVTEVANIARIDVLKGPSSALYGRFEPGGTINVVTKRPLTSDRYEAGVQADEHGLLRTTADLNLARGALAFRLNAAYDNGESFRSGVDNSTFFVAPALRLSLGERTTLNVEGEFLDREGVFDRGFVSNALLLTLPPERFLGDTADSFDNRTTNISAMLTHEISDIWTLRAAGALGRGKSLGNYFFPVGAGAVPLVSATGVLNRRNQITDDGQVDRSAQVELLGRFEAGGVSNKLLLAADWNEDEGSSVIRRSVVNSGINIFAPVYGAVKSPTSASIVNTRARNEAYGVLAQVETEWAPALRTTVGVRAERAKAQFTNLDAATNRTQRSSEGAVTPRAGVTVLPTPQLAIFANWGRSFAPEVGTRPILGNAEPKASKGEQAEGGVRYESADGRVRASASLFRIEKTNIRVAEPAPSPFDVQVGKQRSKGVELDFAARPVDGLRIEAAYALTDAEVTRDRVLAGRVLQATPKHSASVWARYDFTPSVGIGGGAFMVGDRFVDTANTFALDGYERVDAAVYWRPFGPVEVQLNLLNAFGTRYFENGNTNNNLYPGQPRTLRGSVRVTF